MKIIFLDAKWSQDDIHKYGTELFTQIESNFPTAVYNQVNSDFSNIPELFSSEDKLLIFNGFCMENAFYNLNKHLPEFKNIKYLLSTYSSYEGLDLELLKKLNIHFRNNAGANAKSVAQYALTSALMLLSRFPQLANSHTMPDGSILGEELQSQTAGIIGLGHVGLELYTLLSDLSIPTVYYNRSPKSFANQVSFEKIFNQNLIFITLATNPETQNLLQPLPELIQDHNYLIDISAADELYDKNQIINKLASERLRGFAFELWETSKYHLPTDLNLIATPHIAWCTKDAEKRTIINYLTRALTILEGRAQEIDFLT